jgi:hypothetical protein
MFSSRRRLRFVKEWVLGSADVLQRSPPMRQVTKTVYQFDELSDKAKEKARDWFKGILDSDDFDSVTSEAERFGRLMGIDFASTASA